MSQPSLPARGAWIETGVTARLGSARRRRSPRGERGLKPWVLSPSDSPPRRSPRGERGLKHSCAGPASGWRVGRSPRGERGLKLD